MHGAAALSLIAIFSLTSSTYCAKILLTPLPVHSHVNEQEKIGVELVKMGHEVHVMRAANKKLPSLHKGMHVINYGPRDRLIRFETEEFQRKTFGNMLDGNLKEMLEELRETALSFHEVADQMLSEDIFKILEKEKFEFVMVHGAEPFRFLYVIPHRLGVPHGSITSETPLDLFKSLMKMPSLEPNVLLLSSGKMSFFSRVFNSIIYAVAPKALSYMTGTEKFQKYTPNKPYTSLADIAGNSSIWIVPKSPLFDFPTPIPPNVFPMGAISLSKPKPLPKDLQAYADKAKNGIVIVSFGSTVGFLKDKYLIKLINAFEKHPQLSFVMRIKGKLPLKKPTNLKVMEWLPQNDLLAHPNCKLFITHCGNNGVHESLMNGVPMIGLPVQADQPMNAVRISAKGYGISFKFRDVTAEELSDGITEVIKNPFFTANAKKASRVMKSYSLPSIAAAEVIDHVIQYGNDHLIGINSEYEWYQILMWDIFAFLIVVTSIFVYLTYKLLKNCCSKKDKHLAVVTKKKEDTEHTQQPVNKEEFDVTREYNSDDRKEKETNTRDKDEKDTRDGDKDKTDKQEKDKRKETKDEDQNKEDGNIEDIIKEDIVPEQSAQPEEAQPKEVTEGQSGKDSDSSVSTVTDDGFVVVPSKKVEEKIVPEVNEEPVMSVPDIQIDKELDENIEEELKPEVVAEAEASPKEGEIPIIYEQQEGPVVEEPIHHEPMPEIENLEPEELPETQHKTEEHELGLKQEQPEPQQAEPEPQHEIETLTILDETPEPIEQLEIPESVNNDNPNLRQSMPLPVPDTKVLYPDTAAWQPEPIVPEPEVKSVSESQIEAALSEAAEPEPELEIVAETQSEEEQITPVSATIPVEAPKPKIVYPWFTWYDVKTNPTIVYRIAK